MSLDEIDARILTALIRDARARYAVIGNEVGLSASAVKRRVDRLRASGAITGFSARVDPAALGWTTEAYVELFCGGATPPEEIGAAVRRHPEVADACTVTGEADALVHIRASDIRHFEQVVERIAAEPFVRRTRSVIVLSRLVERADSIAPHTRSSVGRVWACQKLTGTQVRTPPASRRSRTAVTIFPRRGGCGHRDPRSASSPSS